jgi:hypothetical protein
MKDYKKIEKELLDEHYTHVIIQLNKFYQEKKCFMLRDLLSPEKNNDYYKYMTKGILLTLISMGYINIFTNFNGYKNYIYQINKEIK